MDSSNGVIMAAKETSLDRKTVAYLRVSTLDQDLEKNKTDILHFANHHDLGKVIFVEEVAPGESLGGNVKSPRCWKNCRAVMP